MIAALFLILVSGMSRLIPETGMLGPAVGAGEGTYGESTYGLDTYGLGTYGGLAGAGVGTYDLDTYGQGTYGGGA